ncbi:MAG: 50S ribosomal protein L35, partial [Deltaproteobacteria bacterium]|nr:50S ribosomal protein L35 [Deltaproteobacteria bacterium]
MGLPGLPSALVSLLPLSGDVMPKMKTHRGAAKRFRFSGSGK